jgi:hypothetical protein
MGNSDAGVAHTVVEVAVMIPAAARVGEMNTVSLRLALVDDPAAPGEGSDIEESWVAQNLPDGSRRPHRRTTCLMAAPPICVSKPLRWRTQSANRGPTLERLRHRCQRRDGRLRSSR